jgi:hypothetical protein
MARTTAKARSKRETSAKTKSRSKRANRPASAPAAASNGIRIRMYRLGVGDCFLLRFPRAGGGDFNMLIDCGVHQSQTGGPDRVREAVADIKRETGGRLDVIVATHEHMDHISGFKQAAEEFQTFEVGEIWFAWTEDDADELARKIAPAKEKALALLETAQQRLRLMGLAAEDAPLTGLLGFFGGGAGKQLKQCGEALKKLSDKWRYHRPGNDPIELDGVEARVFVLGPPRDEKLIGKSDPSKGEKSEVYELAFGSAAAADLLEPALGGQALPLFGHRYVVPLDATKGISFFNRHYWGDFAGDEPREREDLTQSWRRIEADWLDSATSLALKLDEDTNNTSLVLAIELGPRDVDGPVLLFAADAQVGNWLSWQKVEWNYHGRRITGPDLLRRTRLYKVGHHASHNATLRDLGLELMGKLELALIPTDAKMAKKVKWGTLPWGPLLSRLGEKSKKGVIRTDVSRANIAGVRETPLFYEVTL